MANAIAGLNKGGTYNSFNKLSRADKDAFFVNGLDRTARRLLKELKSRPLESATLNQLGVCLGIVLDKSLLLQGRATSNVAIAGRLDAVVKVQALAGKLQSALGAAPPVITIPAGDNGSYSPPALPERIGDTLDNEQVATAPVKRGRGRPRKVRPLPPP